MLFKTKSGSLALALLAATTTLAFGQAAHAQGFGGGWTVTTSNSGSTVTAGGTRADGSSYGPNTSPWFDSASTGSYVPVFVTPGESEQGQVSGTVKFTYTWQGGIFNLPPPPTVWIHEQSNASWVGAGSPLYTSKSGSVEDGLGGTPVTTISPDGYTQSELSHGSKWEKEDSSSGTFDVTISGNASVSVSAFPPDAAGHSGYVVGNADFGASTGIGDHTIVTNGAIETSFYKQFNPNHGQFEAQPHLRASDGSITTDSAVQWSPTTPISPAGWAMTDTTFSATSPFSDTVTYDWTSDQGYFDSQPNSHQSSTLYTISKKDRSSFPLTATITAKVTGSDPGEKDQNTFTATFHLPYEANDLIKTTYSKAILETRVSGVSPGSTSLVKAASAKSLDVSGALDGLAVIFTATGQEEFSAPAEIVSAICKFTKFELDLGPEDQYNGGTNSGVEWQVARSYAHDKYGGGNLPNSPVALNSNGWLYCLMSINEVGDYHTDTWTCDGYTSHGYDGNSNHIISGTQADSIHDEPYFTTFRLIPPPPPPPIRL